LSRQTNITTSNYLIDILEFRLQFLQYLLEQ